MIQDEFQKIHDKLDNMNSKLDNHLERIAKVETHQSWIKTGVLALFAWVSTHFYGGK